MRNILVVTLLTGIVAFPALATPQQQQETLHHLEQQELGSVISRNSYGSIKFMPLQAFEALMQLSSSEREIFRVSDDQLAKYADILQRNREFHSRKRTSVDIDWICHEMIENSAEYSLVHDDEIAASTPQLSLSDLLNRSTNAFVARVEQAEIGFSSTLGTRIQFKITHVLKGDAAEVGMVTSYFLPSYDFWIDGQHLCQGWQAQYKETPGDSVLVLATPTPKKGNFIFFNVFQVIDGKAQPEALRFLKNIPLDLNELLQ